MPTTIATFRCMMCGHEFQEKVEKDEDKERFCPKCRSNSVRRLKSIAAAAKSTERPGDRA